MLQNQLPIIVEEKLEEETCNPTTNNDVSTTIMQANTHSELPSSKNTPYPEDLNLSEIIASPEYDLIIELKNVCIRIPLLQALRDTPIYAKG